MGAHPPTTDGTPLSHVPRSFCSCHKWQVVAYIYSAPPLKLKAEGWLGTYALGSSYIALPWWCGHAMFNAATISWQVCVAAPPTPTYMRRLLPNRMTLTLTSYRSYQ